jgi:carboxylesterase type B
MTLSEAERAGENFASSLGAPAGKDALRLLRNLPAEQLQQAAVATRGGNGPNTGPSIDGWFMPTLPASIYAAGNEHAIPVIIGNNAREQGAPAPEALRKAVTDSYGSNAEQALAYYGLTAPGPGNRDPPDGPRPSIPPRFHMYLNHELSP